MAMHVQMGAIIWPCDVALKKTASGKNWIGLYTIYYDNKQFDDFNYS